MAEYKTPSQVNYGWGLSLNMTGKAPAIAKTIWSTLADLQAYVDNANDSAIAGLQLSVIEDTDNTKNGIYFVNTIGDGTNPGVVTQIGALSEIEIADIKTRLSAAESEISGKQNNISAGNGLSLLDDNLSLVIDPIAGNLLTNSTNGLKVVVPDVVVPEYTVSKLGTPSEGAAASYQLQKDGTGIGAVIDIPKDMVVESGDVKEVTEDDKPYVGAKIGDIYIDIVLANTAGTHIYIPANKLVDNYTGSTYISIDENRVVTLNYTALKTQLSTDLSADFDIAGINTKIGALETAVGDSTSGLVKGLADTNTEIVSIKANVTTVTENVDTLITKVGALETTVGDSTSGLVKGLADLGTRVDTNATSITSLANVVGTKLDESAKVNNKVFTTKEGEDFPSIELTAEDINIVAEVGPNIAGTSIENVLTNLNSRIESAVSGGLTSVVAGNGISVSAVAGNSQTINLKLKENTPIEIAEVGTTGLDIKDMRTYWKSL